METRPRLQTGGLPPVGEDALSATASPARGREMRTSILQKLRPPPLVHAWDFWFDRPSPTNASPSTTTTTTSSLSTSNPAAAATTPSSHAEPEQHLSHLHAISNVGEFWSVMNNFDFSTVPLRHSVHLFHKSVQPRWEDARNVRGGSWTFRLPKDQAPDFWRELCLLAISEQLQSAVESNRMTFRDDICGVSFSPRWGSALISIWNRDADHTAGVEGIKRVVELGMPQPLWAKVAGSYYKRHDEHAGFAGAAGAGTGAAPQAGDQKADPAADAVEDGAKRDPSPASVQRVEEQVAKVRQILEEVKASQSALPADDEE